MKIAIIGYGKMGRLYDSLYPASWIVDTAPEVDAHFSTVDALIESGASPDLAIIASPSERHFLHAKMLLKADIDLLVEKPICMSAREALALQKSAEERGLLLFQSCLERYNPVVKFLKKHLELDAISHIESIRRGVRPEQYLLNNPRYDLGIHDVDLWFHLTDQSIPWCVHAEYGSEQKREIRIFLREGGSIVADLLNKKLFTDEASFDFTRSSSNNPILEMLNDLLFAGATMNEEWHREISLLEDGTSGIIELLPEAHKPRMTLQAVV